MEKCIKNLFDLSNPEEWSLCQEYCLCSTSDTPEEPQCLTVDSVELFCPVSKKNIFVSVRVFLKEYLEKNGKHKNITKAPHTRVRINARQKIKLEQNKHRIL